MAEIIIQIPDLQAKDRIEVEARVNGQKRVYHYRVEIFAWEECEEKAYPDRAHCLKDMISHYEPGWRLQQIGATTDKTVQVLFRQNEGMERLPMRS